MFSHFLLCVVLLRTVKYSAAMSKGFGLASRVTVSNPTRAICPQNLRFLPITHTAFEKIFRDKKDSER